MLCLRHDIILPIIIIMRQECPQALKICKCLLSLSCGGVSNMMLVPSITFHCHCYIWGCMCSTGPFQFMWLKGYIHSSCYYHHQIGNINLTHSYHIFLWLCAWDICYILSLIAYTFQENRDFVFIIPVQFMMSANSWIRFGLMIVFVVHYTISLSSLCKLIWRDWAYKMGWGWGVGVRDWEVFLSESVGMCRPLDPLFHLRYTLWLGIQMSNILRLGITSSFWATLFG